MTRLLRNLFKSSLGKKYLMAGSGAVLFLFVVGHLAGNLQIFIGPESLNRYGNFLQTNVEVLWPVRIVLLILIGIHIWSATKLTLENRVARPQAYQQWGPTVASYASRTMMYSGVIVAIFIIYHLLHFTVMVKGVNFTGHDFDARPEFLDAKGRHDIYKMMITGFSVWWVSAFYILGVGLLCLHLSHGISAMFQSMGWKKRSYGPLLDGAAKWVSILIFLGYISIPVSILCGWVHL
ncbi:MAG TPA: succinate dehydrogenase cytochrome b subunit [Verrucomicrobiae bacterium]|jgi:succinate dehydrogenase / fumarate reductase cytochrome b subunit|nr:succinate dehydrogenase cytochrome b subunit [Verrucomicrobiae bacterium]